MSSVVTFDSREWTQAIQQYSLATRKGVAESVNRALKNVGIKGVQIAKQAEPAAIENLESKDFWPKVVAKLLTRRKLGRAYSRIASRGATKRQQKTGQILSVAYRVEPGGHRSEEAARYSKRLIRKRLTTAGFLRWFFANVARGMDPYAPGKNARAPSRTGNWGGFKIQALPATETNKGAGVTVSYDYRKRRDSSARKAERVLRETLPQAMSRALADIQEYAARKMADAAARHSARAA
jgi:hypothetical protein